MTVPSFEQTGYGQGCVRVRSRRSFEATITDLEREIRERDLVLYAFEDHSGDAAQAGVDLGPTRVLTCGNPRTLTSLIERTPTLALDLPLRLLVQQDDDGRAVLAYTSPEYIAKRHGLDPDALASLRTIVSLVDAVTNAT